MKYAVVIEQTSNNYAAYAPDLPGCVATGSTEEEVVRNIHEAIVMHIETLQELGQPVPRVNTEGRTIEHTAVA